jgi:hypothetical protein
MAVHSENPHRTLLVISLIICALVTFGLVTGWRWYLQHIEVRRAILDFATEKEDRLRQMAAAAVEQEIAPEKQKMEKPDDTVPKVSLTDIARRDTAMSTPDGNLRTGQPYTVTLQFDPNSADVAQAEGAIAAYFAAQEWRAKASHVNDGAILLDAMRDFYEVRKSSDPLLGPLQSRQRYRLDGTEILYYSYESSNRHGNVLEVALRRSTDGKFLIDWESLVGYSEMSWADFKKERPAKPVLFRAFATLSDYYNFEFSDQQEKYLSINLLSPDGLESVHGYCERKSSLGGALLNIMSRSESVCGITLRLAFSEKAESNHCVNITQLVADRWLLLP